MATFHHMCQRILLLSLLIHAASALFARDMVVPERGVAHFFATLPKDVTRVLFSATAVYRCDSDIVLPTRQLLIVEGQGAKLILGPNSNGFTTRVADQKAAMRITGNRYVIRDFASIEGGRKAVDLQASLGSSISNCRMQNQSEAAIDLRFCLMCRVEQVLVTHPQRQGIVVRQGDWPGATGSNSQSNHTVLDQCRVYCSKTTTAAFTVLNCNGVRISNSISEGGPADYDLYLSALAGSDTARRANNSVVKQFTLDNFHVEHQVRKASVHVNMPPQSSVTLRNVYWNGKIQAPVVEYVCGQLNLEDIGWFNKDFRIHSRNTAPRINVLRCHSALRIEADKATPAQAGVLYLVDALSGGEGLKLMYVNVEKSAR